MVLTCRERDVLFQSLRKDEISSRLGKELKVSAPLLAQDFG